MENTIVKIIEENLRLLNKAAQEKTPGELDSKWALLTSSEPKRFINPDMSLKIDALRNFRKLRIFVPDCPADNRLPVLSDRINFNYIDGGRRGDARLLREFYHLMKERNCLEILEKYPASSVGNPNVFKYKEYVYTFRWVRHILFLGLFKQVIEKKLNNNFSCLDIGSSYGIFSSILKKEYCGSHQLLLDFPEQLALAHYFLGCTFPEAKIASYKEISAVEYVDRSFIEKYDFVLLPWFCYKKIKPHSLDMVTNFVSFGEMRREWFDYYLKSEPFLSARYFFTANRFQSYPEYDTDVTILDYSLHDFKKLHFGISPYFTYIYRRKYLFFYEKFHISSQYFEFIGER